jgi:hypothetical protein
MHESESGDRTRAKGMIMPCLEDPAAWLFTTIGGHRRKRTHAKNSEACEIRAERV